MYAKNYEYKNEKLDVNTDYLLNILLMLQHY